MKLNVKYLNSNMPKLSTKEGDSGFDIRANIEKNLTLKAKSMTLVPTGIAVEVTEYPTNDNMSVEIQIRPRSGLTKNGIVAQFGTVDVSYRGELKVNVYNFNETDVEIAPMDRIAQIIIAPIYKPQIAEVMDLSETSRGDKGFGSSGKN